MRPAFEDGQMNPAAVHNHIGTDLIFTVFVSQGLQLCSSTTAPFRWCIHSSQLVPGTTCAQPPPRWGFEHEAVESGRPAPPPTRRVKTKWCSSILVGSRGCIGRCSVRQSTVQPSPRHCSVGPHDAVGIGRARRWRLDRGRAQLLQILTQQPDGHGAQGQLPDCSGHRAFPFGST